MFELEAEMAANKAEMNAIKAEMPKLKSAYANSLAIRNRFFSSFLRDHHPTQYTPGEHKKRAQAITLPIIGLHSSTPTSIPMPFVPM